MVAILSFSTLAWFTDNESVKNDFQIAGSDDDTADEIFSVDVWEDRNNDGVADDDLTNEEEGLNYKDILPGDVLNKVVYVENTGYYDQYIRVTVTVSDYSAWCTVLNKAHGTAFALQEIVNGLDAEHLWNVGNGAIDTNADTITYTLYYQRILVGRQESANDNGVNTQNAVVFTSVKIPASMTQAQAVEFEQNFQITVKAEAVQTENILDTKTGNAHEDAMATFAKLEA
jgi:predicted ribosomally synthesized peptide with SipW-like signal peptide